MDNTLSPEIQEALQRRGGQGQAPQGQPAPQPQPPMPQEPAGMAAQTPESVIIIKALDGRLKALSKLEEMTGQKSV